MCSHARAHIDARAQVHALRHTHTDMRTGSACPGWRARSRRGADSRFQPPGGRVVARRVLRQRVLRGAGNHCAPQNLLRRQAGLPPAPAPPPSVAVDVPRVVAVGGCDAVCLLTHMLFVCLRAHMGHALTVGRPARTHARTHARSNSVSGAYPSRHPRTPRHCRDGRVPSCSSRPRPRAETQRRRGVRRAGEATASSRLSWRLRRRAAR